MGEVRFDRDVDLPQAKLKNRETPFLKSLLRVVKEGLSKPTNLLCIRKSEFHVTTLCMSPTLFIPQTLHGRVLV